MFLLFKVYCCTAVHIAIVEILTAHSPDECVVLGSASRMDTPFRRDDSLIVVHPDVAAFLRLTHEMAYSLVLRKLEIEINLHATLVRVSRHCVPGAARLELCHTHLKLACRNHFLHEHSVDDTVIAFLKGSKLHLDCLFTSGQVVRISSVSR